MSENVDHLAIAQTKAQAVAEIEKLTRHGSPVEAAVQLVADQTGMGVRSLYTYLAQTRGVAPEEWAAVLARKSYEKAAKVVCHPEALSHLISLIRQGSAVSEGYRATKAEAEAKGWTPFPSQRTLYRELDKHLSPSDRWMARRAVKTDGEV